MASPALARLASDCFLTGCSLIYYLEGVLEEGRSPILLTERKEHLEYFSERLSNFTACLAVIRKGQPSGLTPERRQSSKHHVKI